MRILPYPRSDGKLFTMYVNGDEAACLMVALNFYVENGRSQDIADQMTKILQPFKEM